MALSNKLNEPKHDRDQNFILFYSFFVLHYKLIDWQNVWNQIKFKARYREVRNDYYVKKKKKKLESYICLNNAKFRNYHFFDKNTRAKEDKQIQCVNECYYQQK